MDVYLEISGSQIDGARDYQEDAFLTSFVDDDPKQPKSTALVVMADGMGGHAAGNIASNLVVSTFNKHFNAHFGQGEVPQILRDALDKANEGLRSAIKETPALDGMGCTMVTAALARGRMWWISVGDSHLYVIRDRELIKKNEDHSYGGYLDRMKAQGMNVDAEQGLSRNMLMSAITGEEIAEIDCPGKSFQLLAGDRLIIASDGLDTLSAGTVLQTSLWSPSPKECVDALLKAVEDAKRPRQDNTTVIVCDVIKREGGVVAPPRSRTEQDRNRDGDTQPMDSWEVTRAREDLTTQPGLAGRGSDDALQKSAQTRKGRGGIIAAVVVLLLAALAGGGWWYFMGGGPGTPEPVASVETPESESAPEPVSVPDLPPEPEPAPESGTATGSDAEVSPPETTDEPAEPIAEQPVTSESTPAAATEAETFRDSLASGGEGPLMVRIPAGTFLMGLRGSTLVDQRPEHQVRVPAFAFSAHEITFAEYERFARASGRRIPDNFSLDKDVTPVFGVTWEDALAYAQWLSRETGERYRVPSEAEWEYAAGAGTETPYWWGYQLGQNRAHCFNCTPSLNPRQPTSVGSFDPNPFGVFDTVGNVAEWVYDCYHPNYRDAPSNGSVWEGGDCSVRVVRGGSYSSPTPTTQRRNKLPSRQGYPDVGIRVARDL